MHKKVSIALPSSKWQGRVSNLGISEPRSMTQPAAQGLVNHRVPGPLTQPGAGAQQLLWCSIP